MKTFAGAGLVKGDFKSGGGVMTGFGSGQVHSEVALGYEGLDKPGIKGRDWRVGAAEYKQEDKTVNVWSAAPADDGGLDYTKAYLKATGGHADKETMERQRAQLA